MNEEILTFFIDEKLFGIEIQKVKEISRKVEYGIVPDSETYIVGLLNLRGQIVTLLDIIDIIDSKNVNKEIPNKVNAIILKKNFNTDDQVGFVIDEAVGVVEVSEESKERVPANLDEIKSNYIKNVVKLKDNLLLILDVEKILSIEDNL